MGRKVEGSWLDGFFKLLGVVGQVSIGASLLVARGCIPWGKKLVLPLGLEFVLLGKMIMLMKSVWCSQGCLKYRYL